MSLVSTLENLGVEVAFAEAGAWTPEFAASLRTPTDKHRPMSSQRRRAARRATFFGVLSIAMYAGVFAFADQIMASFTKGGWHAILPVATVFAFSYVHGTFAGHVWTALGINAATKTRQTVQPPVEAVQRKRPRPRVQAPRS